MCQYTPVVYQSLLGRASILIILHVYTSSFCIYICYNLYHSECTGDEKCSSGYFCGSPLPKYGSNYFDHVGEAFEGDSTFLQKNTMEFDGKTVMPLPNTLHPQLSSDLTIFATVCQNEGNDGYIVGKGLNDRVRDFGLYFRSRRRTVWLAYGYNDGSVGDEDRFREILFFTDVLIADGSCHSIASVIDHSSNRAILYIDGIAVGTKMLPSTPEFIPEVRSQYKLTYIFQLRSILFQYWEQCSAQIYFENSLSI